MFEARSQCDSASEAATAARRAKYWPRLPGGQRPGLVIILISRAQAPSDEKTTTLSLTCEECFIEQCTSTLPGIMCILYS